MNHTDNTFPLSKKDKATLRILLFLLAICIQTPAFSQVSSNKSFFLGTNNVLRPNETNFFAVNSNLLNSSVAATGGGGGGGNYNPANFLTNGSGQIDVTSKVLTNGESQAVTISNANFSVINGSGNTATLTLTGTGSGGISSAIESTPGGLSVGSIFVSSGGIVQATSFVDDFGFATAAGSLSASNVTASASIAAATNITAGGQFKGLGAGLTNAAGNGYVDKTITNTLSAQVVAAGTSTTNWAKATFTPLVNTNWPHTYWVSTSGSDANPGTNALFPFLTITNALVAASNSLASNVIIVGPGVYSIATNSIICTNTALIGQGIDKTFITFPYLAANEPGLVIQGDNVFLHGFTLGTNTANGSFYFPLIPWQGTNFYAEQIKIVGDSDSVYAKQTTWEWRAPFIGRFHNCSFNSGFDVFAVSGTGLGTNSELVLDDCAFNVTVDTAFSSPTIHGLFLQNGNFLVENCAFNVSNSLNTVTSDIYLLGNSSLCYCTVANNIYSATNQNYPATQSPIYLSGSDVLTVVGSINQSNITTISGTIIYDSPQFASVNIGGSLVVANKITNTFLTASQLTGTDANDALTSVAIGSGLALSGGTLSATGGGSQTPLLQNVNAANNNLTNLALLQFSNIFTLGANGGTNLASVPVNYNLGANSTVSASNAVETNLTVSGTVKLVGSNVTSTMLGSLQTNVNHWAGVPAVSLCLGVNGAVTIAGGSGIYLAPGYCDYGGLMLLTNGNLVGTNNAGYVLLTNTFQFPFLNPPAVSVSMATNTSGTMAAEANRLAPDFLIFSVSTTNFVVYNTGGGTALAASTWYGLLFNVQGQ